MIDVTLDVKGSADLLKVDWRSPAAGVAAYQIAADQLINRATVVRERLQDLITAAMNRTPNEPLKLGSQLKELARAGRKLRDRIFFAEAGDDQDEGDEAEKWLASLTEAVIHVTIDRQIYIPWGLAYDGDPEALSGDPEDMSLTSFSDFWCLKYGLSTLYNRMRDTVVRNPRTTAQAQIVKLINQDAWTKALNQAPPSEQSLVTAVFKTSPICSRSDFEKVWKTQKKCLETDLLYFFGHADGTAIAFEKDDLLTMDDFPEILKRKPPADLPACMVFLNGCHTAIGDDRQGGFLQATAYRGFCGFVGTEAAVPDVFALRFANAFLNQLLYTGSRAIEVMNKLRCDYWPLSLAYNLSCHPDFRFNPQGVTPPAVPAVPDFSKDAIGSDKV